MVEMRAGVMRDGEERNRRYVWMIHGLLEN
jgi:hypothetical protein